MTPPEIHALVVDDDPFQCETTRTLLRQIGVASISEAADGREAWKLLCSPGAERSNLVICDIGLPNMDGLELVRRLGERFPGTALILMSGRERGILAAAEAMAGSTRVNLLGSLVKPFSRARLYSLLRRIGARRRHAAPLPEEWQAIPLEAIERGLEANEFHAFYQPKVALEDGRPVGMEALARWISPRYGVVPPAAFIPRIEGTPLMDRLTAAMLREALTALAAWGRAGHSLHVSVNLAAGMLGQPDLAARLGGIVERLEVPPERLIFEITESSALSDVATSVSNLARLRLRGFGLSLDDFGTGFSSIQHLSQIPFTEIKIDRSFVDRALEQEYVRSIVESSLDMGRRLALSTTAEGVESVAQWRYLRKLGCELAQGYAIARPIPRAHILEWLRGWTPPAAELSTAGRSVLVVEDEPFQREVIATLTAELGFEEVVSATDCAEARAMLASQRFDLLITDLALGDGDGRNLIRALRAGETRSPPHTPIVVLTARTEHEVIADVFELDVNGFLSKPVNAAQLEAEIDSALAEPPRAVAEHPGQALTAALTGGERVVAARTWGLLPGMRLEEDLLRKDGRLLLRRGVVLSEQVIDRLQDMSEQLDRDTVRVAVPE